MNEEKEKKMRRDREKTINIINHCVEERRAQPFFGLIIENEKSLEQRRKSHQWSARGAQIEFFN
jgi:hypothetical protein